MPREYHPIYRDGRVHVLKERCETCIFHSGNRMSLSRGRVAQMVRDAKRDEGCIVCHSTLGTKAPAVCRGFFDLHATQPLQIADRMAVIEFQEPPKK